MKRTTSWTLMAAHVCLAAGTYVLSKPAAVGFPDPASLTLARALGAAVGLLALSGWLVPWPRFSWRDWLAVAGLGVLLVPLNQYLFLRGMRHTAPGHPALLYALTPLLVLLLASLWRRQRPSRAKSLGVGIALVGVLVLLRPWDRGELARELRSGDLWISAAVVSWAVYTVAAARLCRRHDPRTVTSWSLILGAAAMVPFGLRSLLRLEPAVVTPAAWVGLAWLVVVTSLVMMLVWNVLLRHLEPVEVAICSNAQPPATAALSALLVACGLHQGNPDLGLLYVAGMVLVLAGIALVQRRD